MSRPALVAIHPSSTSRIERKADELDAANARLKEIKEQCDDLKAQLLRLTKREGEADEDGKIRYQTDKHKFLVIAAESTTVSGKKAIQNLIKLGVNAKTAKKAIDRATSHTPYEYVRIDSRAD